MTHRRGIRILEHGDGRRAALARRGPLTDPSARRDQQDRQDHDDRDVQWRPPGGSLAYRTMSSQRLAATSRRRAGSDRAELAPTPARPRSAGCPAPGFPHGALLSLVELSQRGL